MTEATSRMNHHFRWEIEVAEEAVPVEVSFSYYPGAPARFSPWPGDPPEPADVELHSIRAVVGNTTRDLTEAEEAAADAWWWECGEDYAVEHAAEARFA